jgi:hypothetical protein
MICNIGAYLEFESCNPEYETWITEHGTWNMEPGTRYTEPGTPPFTLPEAQIVFVSQYPEPYTTKTHLDC